MLLNICYVECILIAAALVGNGILQSLALKANEKNEYQLEFTSKALAR